MKWPGQYRGDKCRKTSIDHRKPPTSARNLAISARRTPGIKKGDPTHPSELADPCCIPALGEFTRWTPHGIREDSLLQAQAKSHTASARHTVHRRTATLINALPPRIRHQFRDSIHDSSPLPAAPGIHCKSTHLHKYKKTPGVNRGFSLCGGCGI